MHGVEANPGHASNKGGTLAVEGVKVTLTDANHSSSSFEDGRFVSLGEPAGVVLELEDGFRIYFAGDTNVFGDMSLIGRIYSPDVAVLPIGDHYTMGPREAAVALELLGVIRCVPCHYGTFPLLTGTPAALRELAPAGVEVARARTRRDAHVLMRERWFGATGRKVPAIALEGTIDLEGALVLDDVSDIAAIHAAHEAGTPVVVRASTAEEVHAALSLGLGRLRPRPRRGAPRARPRGDDVLAESLVVATYSICACDLEARQWGVAVQSKFLAVGSVVPWAEPLVGAIATQAYANPRYGPDGLVLLREGLSGRRGRRR